MPRKKRAKKEESEPSSEESEQEVKKPKRTTKKIQKVEVEESSDEAPPPKREPEVKIPDPLKCSLCNELFIEPQMYVCGHSVCKICCRPRSCPVCSTMDYHISTIPNIVVDQYIQFAFPVQYKARQAQLQEIQHLKERITFYFGSKRYKLLSDLFDELIRDRLFLTWPSIVKSMSASKKAKISNDEVLYFLSCKLRENNGPYAGTGQTRYTTLGEYIIRIMTNEQLVDWLEKKKKDENQMVKKWMPILFQIYAFSEPSILERLAKLSDLDLGTAPNVEKWRTVSPLWIKDVPEADCKRAVDLESLFLHTPPISYAHHSDNLVFDSDEDQFSMDDSDEDDCFF